MALMTTLPSLRLLFLSFLLSLGVALALVACAGPEAADVGTPVAPPSVAPPAPTAEPSPTALPRGGNLTVRIAADIDAFRPWQPRNRDEEQLIELLYSGLVRLDAQLRPQPDLASDWQASADGRTITFTLRSGLTWHDGEPLDAGDVVYTLEALRALPVTGTALLVDLQYIEAVTTPNSTTVALTLTERYAPLLARLSLPILPRHLLADRDLALVDFWETPVGSGPFQLSERTPGQSIVLERFAGFHRGAPLLDRVAFVLADSAEVALQALRDEELLLAELPWGAERSAAGLDVVRLASYPENGYYFLGFNLREGRPFADLAVRQALATALDRERLVVVATNGRGIPIDSSAVPGSWADLTAPLTATGDLEAARSLLDEAGWTLASDATIRQRDGVTLTAQLFVRADDERRLVAANRIAEVAASIGMRIEVQPADFDTVIMSKYVAPYDFDLLLGGWVNGAGDPTFGDFRYYDPDDFALFHSSQINQGVADTRVTRNFVAFSDPAYDNQIQAARQLYDFEARAVAYQQAQERVAAQLPYLYLWADRMPVALNEQVTTLDGPVDLASPRYLWNIERWYFAP